MRCWYFSEMAYHPAWEEGLARGSLRVVLPSSNFDPPRAPASCCNRYLDEFALCDEVGTRHHGERAPQHRDLHDRVGADGAVDHRARNEKRAAADAGQLRSPTGPIRCASPRKWPGSTAVRRPAGDGPGERRAVRDRARQLQSRDADAAILGSARPDPEGDVHHDGPFNWEGEYLPLSQRQHLAAADPAADAAGVDDRHERRYRQLGGGTRPRRRHTAVRRHGEADVRRVSQARPRTRLGGGAGPHGLCRHRRRRQHTRRRPAAGRHHRRLCAHRAGGGGAVHQSARLQLDRRQCRRS